MLGTVTVLLVLATLLFLLACVSPRGDGVLQRARRLVFAEIPNSAERLSIRVCGPRFFPGVKYYSTYLFTHPTPFFQLTYLSLAFFGFYIFWVYGFSQLPNEYFSGVHIYTGTAAFVVTVATFVLACTTPPGQVTPKTVKYYQSAYRYDHILFDERNYRYFLGFLLTTTLICVYAAVVGVSILVSEIKRDKLLTGVYYNGYGEKIPASYTVAASYLVHKQPSFIFILLLCVLMCVALGGFLAHHCYLASTNVTSYERVKRMDKVYNLENDLADHPEKAETLKARIDTVSQNPYDKGLKANWGEVFQ